MVVIYFFALVFTLAMATADASLARHWTDWDPDTTESVMIWIGLAQALKVACRDQVSRSVFLLRDRSEASSRLW